MQIICLDFREIESREELHDFLERNLELPEYYGRNLDALYDVLTEESEETVISVTGIDDETLGYFKACVSVLRDAARENDRLTVRFPEENEED